VELFAATSFSRSMFGAPLRPTPFRASRMRTLRGPSRSLRSLHRTWSTSDVPLSLSGTPESDSDSARCAVPGAAGSFERGLWI